MLNVNIEPANDIILSDKSTSDKNCIYLNKNMLEIKDKKLKLIKIVGVLAHEDTHYILRKLIPLYKELYDKWKELKEKFGNAVKFLAVFDETLPTIIEYIIRLEYSKKLNFPKEKINEKYENFLKELLENLNSENLGYIIGTLIILSVKDKEKLKKLVKMLIR